MKHRKLNMNNSTLNRIHPDNLDLSEYKEEKEKLESIQNGPDKLFFITTYLENNINVQDIFSNLFYNNNNIMINNLVKYYLIYILSLLDEDVRKKSFPRMPVKTNNIIIDKNNPLHISQKLFQIYFFLLLYSEKTVQYTCLELILEYSDKSQDFVDYCLKDIRYIEKVFTLTYNNNNSVINKSLIILDIILNNESCDEDDLEKLLQKNSIIQRCKELLCDSKFDIDIKINSLELIETIADKMSTDYYKSYFYDYPQIFYEYMTHQPINETIIKLIYNISGKISNEDTISLQMKNTGLADLFYQHLSKQDLETDFLLKLLTIFNNLLYMNENITYFIIEKNADIIKVFISIINTYLHSLNEKASKIFYDLLYCISNLVTGPNDTKFIISKSELPNQILQVMKEKKNDNKVYSEGVRFFINIIEDCDKETFCNISEFHPFKLYAKGLKDTSDNKNLELYLKAMLELINKNNAVYHTIENLKNEYYMNLVKKRIDDLTFHTNEKISQNAKLITNVFEDKMNME